MNTVRTIIGAAAFLVMILPADALAVRQRRGPGGAGFFTLGTAALDIGALNDRLRSAGYAPLADRATMIGGGLYGRPSGRWLIGGEGYAFSSGNAVTGDFNASLSGGAGFLEAGYLLVAEDSFFLAPIVGIGGAGFSFRLTELGVLSFNDILANPRREATLTTGGFMMNLGIAGLFPIDIDPKKERRGGLIIGFRLGYLFMPAGGDWTLGGTTVLEGPLPAFAGPYVAITIGAGGGSVRGR